MPSRVCLIAAFAGSIALMTGAQASEIKPHPEGFWKMHPPRDVKGEYSNEDPMGLAYHRHISTDCSIAWKDLSKNKIYCFSSPMSLSFFQDDSAGMLSKADAFWSAEHSVPRS